MIYSPLPAIAAKRNFHVFKEVDPQASTQAVRRRAMNCRPQWCPSGEVTSLVTARLQASTPLSINPVAPEGAHTAVVPEAISSHITQGASHVIIDNRQAKPEADRRSGTGTDHMEPSRLKTWICPMIEKWLAGSTKENWELLCAKSCSTM